MSYDPNVPLVSQSLGQTQSLINTNFSLIDTSFKVNHIGAGLTGAGKHNFVTLPDQSSAPTNAANEGSLYTKALSGVTTLYFREEGASGTEQQVSGSVVNGANGECPLFGGFSLKWGALVITSSPLTVTYTALGLTAYGTNTYAVILVPKTLTASQSLEYVTSKTSTSFAVTNSSTGAQLQYDWIAIGR